MNRFTNIDHMARFYLDINLTEYCIADSIFNLQNSYYSKSGWCEKTQTEIGEFIGLSRAQVNRIYARLVDKGIAEKKGKKIRLKELWHRAHELTQDEKKEIVAKCYKMKSHNVTEESNKVLQYNVTKRDKHLYIQKGTENSKQEGSQKTIDIWPNFEDFWNAGLSKQDKERSLRYWKKISQKDREKIMAYIPEYLESNEKQFLRGTASFLFKKTWNNDIINRKKATNLVNRAITEAGTHERVRGYFEQDE